MEAKAPSKIRLHRRSQRLELAFDDRVFFLPAEYLRVFSPSAEVKGHGPGQEVLQLNKSQVAITGIEAQGNYAIRVIYSDHHDSGIYTWQYLLELAENQETYWMEYLDKVQQHQGTAGVSIVKIIDFPANKT